VLFGCRGLFCFIGRRYSIINQDESWYSAA